MKKQSVTPREETTEKKLNLKEIEHYLYSAI